MKRIVFGSVLSAFLLVSMVFMSPVQVQAAENEVKNIWSDICSLAEDLAGDQDFIDFLDSKSFKRIFLDYNSNNISSEQYINELKNSSEWSKLMMLEEKYSSRLEKLNSSFCNWFKTIDKKESDSGISKEKYYRLFSKEGIIKVKSQDNDKVSGDDVLLVISESSIVIKTDEGELDIDLVFQIATTIWPIIMGILILVVIVCWAAADIVGPYNQELGKKLTTIGFIFAFLCLIEDFYMPISRTIAYIIVFLLDVEKSFVEDTSKTVEINIFEKINLFLKSSLPNLLKFFGRFVFQV